MSGRRWTSPQARGEIGRAVVRARAVGAPWKLLERAYGRDRDTLARWARDCGKNAEDCGISGVEAARGGGEAGKRQRPLAGTVHVCSAPRLPRHLCAVRRAG